jgi:hypothetical protein
LNQTASATTAHAQYQTCILRLIVPLCLAATISNVVAAPAAQEAEDRYIAARDAAGEDEYKRCFTQKAPRQPSFARATRQAQELLSAALNKR